MVKIEAIFHQIHQIWTETSARNSRSETKIPNRLCLRAQAELGELLGISKHKTWTTMSLELILGPENTILRSRTNFFRQNPPNLDQKLSETIKSVEIYGCNRYSNARQHAVKPFVLTVVLTDLYNWTADTLLSILDDPLIN